MSRLMTICMAGVAVLVLSRSLAAEGPREGVVEGTFLRLIEQKVGEQEYPAIVVKPAGEGRESVTIFVPRKNADLMERVRKLSANQKVRVEYVLEAEQRWSRRIDVQAGEPAKATEPRRAEGEKKDAETASPEVRELRAQLDRLQKEAAALRAENARLKEQLAKKEAAGKEASGKEEIKKDQKDRPAPGKEEKIREGAALPEGLRGFRGMVVGTVVSKGERNFVLKIEKVTDVWKENQAKNPQSAAGKDVTIHLPVEGRLLEQHLKVFRGLKAGDRVKVEPFNLEGNRLVVVEELKKVD